MSRRLLWWLATLAGGAAGILLVFRAPVEGGPVLCLFRRLVDLPCPGCGLTRAVAYLARGDLAAALALHPLAPLITAELAVAWGLIGLVAHGARPAPRGGVVERWLVATGLLLVAVWLGRLAIGDLTALGRLAP